VPLAAAVALLVAAHLVAEARGARAARAATKAGASLGFVLLALALGVDGPAERCLLAGLVLSVAGDVLLLSARRPAFLAGLGAFLLAHVAYAAAFAALGTPSPWVTLPIAAAIPAVLAWLWPHLGPMRLPVVAYCLVISAMLWLALGVARPEIRAGAALFYASDLLVARDRFVRPGFANRLVGLPLYYAAQLLLAHAVA
jgi:uncharacterized membrane protein YhhN